MNKLYFILLVFLVGCSDFNKSSKDISNQDQHSGKDTLAILKIHEDNFIGTMASKEIINAIVKGNVEKVRILLKKGEDPNGRCQGYLRGGRKEGDGNVTDQQWTLLMLAAYRHQMPVVKLLLSNNADINSVNAAGHSALFLACASREQEIAMFLLQNGADISRCGQDKDGMSTLQWALTYGWNDVSLKLIQSGADVNTSCSQTGRNILLEALYSEDITSKIIIEIIDRGANVNEPTSDHTTPLMMACSRNDMLLVKKMMEKNVDINYETKNGSTALCFAARNEGPDCELMDFLISKGAKIDIENLKGRSALVEAVNSNSIQKVKYLVEHHADVNRKSEEFAGVFPLYEAVFNVNYEISKYLIENGADIFQEGYRGETVLLRAIFNENSYKIIKLLIDKGIDVNKSDDDRMTPLMKAAEYNLPDIASLLIKSGARKEGKDVYGKTAKTYAEESAERTGEKNIVSLF